MTPEELPYLFKHVYTNLSYTKFIPPPRRVRRGAGSPCRGLGCLQLLLFFIIATGGSTKRECRGFPSAKVRTYGGLPAKSLKINPLKLSKFNNSRISGKKWQMRYDQKTFAVALHKSE